MKLIYTLFFLITNASIQQVSSQNIYNVAGGVSNGLRIKNAYMGLRAVMTVDKDNNIIASATDYTMYDIRKYDFRNDLVQTIAGNDSFGPFTEGGKATQTCLVESILDQPTSVMMDDFGNIYMADGDLKNCTIRKISTDGYVTTFAGTGIRGFSGDGGPARLARLDHPSDIIFNKQGDMLIADELNNRIRKVDKNGIITTYAGTGVAGHSGDGGPADSAQLNHPSSLAVDRAGNIYINDLSNGRIRKIDTSGIISTYFHQPPKDYYLTDIGIDSNFNLYAIVGFNVDKVVSPNVLQQVNASNVLTEPQCLAIDRNNNILVSDDYNMHKILKDGSTIHLFGNSRQLAFTDSAYASDVTVGVGYPANMPLVYNRANKSLYAGTAAQIYKLDSTNNLLLLIGGTGAYHSTGDGGDAKKASFVLADFTIDKNQNIILSDNEFSHIRKIDTAGIINTIAGTGTGFSGDGGPALKAKFNNPQGIAEDKYGNIFIADKYNNRIRRIDAQTNIITTYAGNGDENYYGDGGPATLAALNQPDDLAFDKNDNLYITDTKNHVIRKVDPNGIITSLTRKANFEDIAFDNLNNLYYTDGTYIFKGDTTGKFTQIAGSASDTVSKDGSSALKTTLEFANSFAIDNNNNLYIQTALNIKKLVAACFTQHIADVSSLRYKYVNKPELIYDECNVICSIEPNGNRYDMLNSIVKSQVTIKSSVIKHDQLTFVRRYYTLIPELKIKSCESKLTLYFTNEDFHNFNLNRGNQNRLPNSDTDLAAIKNIRIVQTFDSSLHNYKIIDPADNDITWNDSLACWQISFDVTGLGGFYLTTNNSNKSADITSQNLTSHSNVSIQPNPANDIINITVDKSLINTTAVLMDVNGRLIQSIKLNASGSSVNISSLSNGVYFIKFVDGSVHKFIKG